VKMPTRLLFALAALACLVLAAGASDAGARKSAKKAIWGPLTRDGKSQFPIYRDLGAGTYIMRINWDTTAPTRPGDAKNPADPAYRWPASVDYAIAEGRRYGIRMAVVLTGAPPWASGHRDPRWAPRRPSDFARFAYAASVRWPAVRLWQIWTEPTRRANFMPERRERRDRPLTRRMRKAPHLYARILDSSYVALKRRSRRNVVIGGNSFTTGDISPRNWIRNLRLPNGRPPRMDLYGHNPFSARRPLAHRPHLGHGFADFSDLDLLARWVDRYLARPRHKRRLRFFFSELFWPTDHRNHEFNFWVTRRTAALWLRDALRTTRRWSRIHTLAWLSLYDDPKRPRGDQTERGLLTRDGRRKPAYFAYRRG
jgi:hypothetical protein